MTIMKDVVWWTRVKGLDTFLFIQSLIHFCKFYLKRKIGMEREVLASSHFVERGMKWREWREWMPVMGN